MKRCFPWPINIRTILPTAKSTRLCCGARRGERRGRQKWMNQTVTVSLSLSLPSCILPNHPPQLAPSTLSSPLTPSTLSLSLSFLLPALLPSFLLHAFPQDTGLCCPHMSNVSLSEGSEHPPRHVWQMSEIDIACISHSGLCRVPCHIEPTSRWWT